MENDDTASRWISHWIPAINWDTPAGAVLRGVLSIIPEGSCLTLFGSAPLQITVDTGLLSRDVDLFCDTAIEDLIVRHGLGPKQTELFVQVCDELNFRTSPRWAGRAYRESIRGRHLVIPHPIDILIAKLHRLEDKDMRAFEAVRARTGHPTEAEMRHELMRAVDLFRPGFDEEGMQGDITVNTRILWQEFFGRDIDVRNEIIAPALAIRRKGYEGDRALTDYKAILRSKT